MPEINLNTIPGIVKAVQELQKAVQALERRMAEPPPALAAKPAPKPVFEPLEPMLTTSAPPPAEETPALTPRRGRPRREGADYG